MEIRGSSSSSYINYKPLSTSLVETPILGDPLEYFFIDVISIQNNDFPLDTKECLDKLFIKDLPELKLLESIEATVEPDECGFLAKTIKLPLHSYGASKEEAISNLKHNIQSLYEELMEDDDFTEEWLNHKNYLKEIIIKKG